MPAISRRASNHFQSLVHQWTILFRTPWCSSYIYVAKVIRYSDIVSALVSNVLPLLRLLWEHVFFFPKLWQKSVLAENVSSSCFYRFACVPSLWMKSFIMFDVICTGSSFSLFIIFSSTIFIRFSLDFFFWFRGTYFICCMCVWGFICLAWWLFPFLLKETISLKDVLKYP